MGAEWTCRLSNISIFIGFQSKFLIFVYFCQHTSVSILGTLIPTNNDNDAISSSLCLLYFSQHSPTTTFSIMLFSSPPSSSLLLFISRKLCSFQNLPPLGPLSPAPPQTTSSCSSCTTHLLSGVYND